MAAAAGDASPVGAALRPDSNIAGATCTAVAGTAYTLNAAGFNAAAGSSFEAHRLAAASMV